MDYEYKCCCHSTHVTTGKFQSLFRKINQTVQVTITIGMFESVFRKTNHTEQVIVTTGKFESFF